MAAIFGPGGPIILPWIVRGDRFQGGTVHGVTAPISASSYRRRRISPMRKRSCDIRTKSSAGCATSSTRAPHLKLLSTSSVSEPSRSSLGGMCLDTNPVLKAAFERSDSYIVLMTSSATSSGIDSILSILVAMVFISEVKLSRLVSQFQASLTKLSALLWVMVQFRYNV